MMWAELQLQWEQSDISEQEWIEIFLLTFPALESRISTICVCDSKTLLGAMGSYLPALLFMLRYALLRVYFPQESVPDAVYDENQLNGI